jgi:hypothetical protein
MNRQLQFTTVACLSGLIGFAIGATSAAGHATDAVQEKQPGNSSPEVIATTFTSNTTDDRHDPGRKTPYSLPRWAQWTLATATLIVLIPTAIGTVVAAYAYRQQVKDARQDHAVQVSWWVPPQEQAPNPLWPNFETLYVQNRSPVPLAAFADTWSEAMIALEGSPFDACTEAARVPASCFGFGRVR